MIAAHFARRVLECIFVHIYSNNTINISKFLFSLSHFWIILGLLTCYSLFHPSYIGVNWNRLIYWAIVVVYGICEVLNCCCHVLLMTLRSHDKSSYRIPYVSLRK